MDNKLINMLDIMETGYPCAQNAVNLFQPNWATVFPDSLGLKNSGHAVLFEDSRINWSIEKFGSLEGKKVLELGFLEGAHSYILDRQNPRELTCIDANSMAYLKALTVKEIMGMKTAKFLLGDFNKYLESTEKWDYIYACGVLYHMKNPLELLMNICKNTDNVYIWTHYFDKKMLEDAEIAPRFQEDAELSSGDFKCVGRKHDYMSDLNQGKFLGGTNNYSVWLERQDIFDCLAHFGLKNIEIQFDNKHEQLPNFSFIAKKI